MTRIFLSKNELTHQTAVQLKSTGLQIVFLPFPKDLIKATDCKLSQLIGANFDKSYL
jgi:hypothetical protein